MLGVRHLLVGAGDLLRVQAPRGAPMSVLILNSREAMVLESMAVAVSWRKKKSNVGLGAYAY